MTEKTDGIFNTTQPVVMTHPQLFEARAIGPKGRESGKPKFSASFLFKPESQDLKDMKNLALKVAKAKWASRDIIADVKANTFKMPFASGDAMADRQKNNGKDGDYNRGHVVLSARSIFQPALVLIQNNKLTDLTGEARLANKDKFFFGAEVLLQVNFVAYQGIGTNPDGVTAYMQMVVATGKGTLMKAAGQSSSDAFSTYMGSVSMDNPLGNTAEDF